MTWEKFLELLALVPPTASVEVFYELTFHGRGLPWAVYLRSSRPCFPSGLPLASAVETALLDGCRSHSAAVQKAQRYRRWLEQTRMGGQS